MPHTLILGITETGKTTLAYRLANTYKQKGTEVLVLDPLLSSRWAADFITDDAEKFLRIVFAKRKCALFVDEAGDMLDKYDSTMNKLATFSRHYGHNAHFICQRAIMVSPTIRAQCTNLFLFKQHRQDAEILARDFVSDDLLQATKLLKGEFLSKIGVDGIINRSKLFDTAAPAPKKHHKS